MAPRENLELRRFQLKDHGSRDPALLARRSPGQLGEFADHWLRLRKRHVAFKRVLRRDGLCRPVRHDFTLVDTARQFVQPDAVPTEAAFELGQVEPSQIRDGVHPKALELFFSDFSDSGQTAHRQGQQKRVHLLGLYDKESVRLFPVRRNLREEFISCDACRGRQVEFRTNLFANRARHLRRGRQARLVLRNIEIGFVK